MKRILTLAFAVMTMVAVAFAANDKCATKCGNCPNATAVCQQMKKGDCKKLDCKDCKDCKKADCKKNCKNGNCKDCKDCKDCKKGNCKDCKYRKDCPKAKCHKNQGHKHNRCKK